MQARRSMCAFNPNFNVQKKCKKRAGEEECFLAGKMTGKKKAGTVPDLFVLFCIYSHVMGVTSIAEPIKQSKLSAITSSKQ